MKTPKLKKLILSIAIAAAVSISGYAAREALAEEINYCLDGTPTFSKISLAGSAATKEWLGTAANITDDDIATYIGAYIRSSRTVEGTVSARYEAVVEFTRRPGQISRVTYNRYAYTAGGIDGVPASSTGGGYIKTYLWYDDQWNQINEETINKSITLSGEKTISGPWYSVSKAKVEVYIWASGDDRHTQWFDSKLYELQAFGDIYDISGYVRHGDGTGINSTLVTLKDSSEFVVDTATTHNNGTYDGWYEITDLSPGNYIAEASFEDYPFNPMPFVLNSEMVNFNFYTYIISGNATRYGPDETGVDGATITVTKEGEEEPYKTTTTGADGSYELKIPGGTFEVEVTNPQ